MSDPLVSLLASLPASLCVPPQHETVTQAIADMRRQRDRWQFKAGVENDAAKVLHEEMDKCLARAREYQRRADEVDEALWLAEKEVKP